MPEFVLRVAATEREDGVRQAMSAFIRRMDPHQHGAIGALFKTGEFAGKEGEIAVIVHPRGYRAGRLLLVGLGEKKNLSPDAFRKAMGHVSRNKTVTSSDKAAVVLDGYDNPAYYQGAAEGHLLGQYKLLDFKSGESAKDTVKLSELSFVVSGRTALAVPLSNPSELGGTERIIVYTTFLADGSLFYYLTLAPDADARVYQQTFVRIGQSLRLTDVRR